MRRDQLPKSSENWEKQSGYSEDYREGIEGYENIIENCNNGSIDWVDVIVNTV